MATTKPSGTDDDQLWRDYLETGIKALNGGNLHLAEVALLDSLKHAGTNGGSTYHVEQSLELLGELAARIYFENQEERAVQLCEQILQIGYPILGGQNNAVYTAACLLADRYFDLEQEQSTTPKQAVLEELAQILSQAGQVVMGGGSSTAASGLSGAQCHGLVGPNTAIAGRPSAAAMCISPESLDTAASAQDSARMASRRSWPVRSRARAPAA